MATTFGSVSEQSQSNRVNQKPFLNHQTNQNFTNHSTTNGLFAFSKAFKYFDGLDYQLASVKATGSTTTPSKANNMLDNIWQIPSKHKNNQTHQESLVDQIDILTVQPHFQLQHSQNQSSHSLFSSSNNMDTNNLQQSQQNQQPDHLQQTAPNCNFGELNSQIPSTVE